MKKSILSVSLSIFLSLTLASCSEIPCCYIGTCSNGEETSETDTGTGEDSHTEHTYDEGKVTKEATCTEDGEKTYTCTVCGNTYTEKIVALGHDYQVDTENSTAATCGEVGSIVYVCSRCNNTYSIEVNPTGEHTYDSGTVTKEATCTSDGEILYTCLICGDTYTDTIPNSGHNYEDGYDSEYHYKECSICHDIINRETHTLTYSYLDDTYHNVSCNECEYSDSLEHELEYSDNGDTHLVSCSDCTYEDEESHTYDNGSDTCSKCNHQESLDYGYVVEGDTISITGMGTHELTSEGELIIPETYLGYAVTSIGANAFQNNTDIISTTIPDSIETIEAYAFDGCSNMTSINFDENSSLTYIGNFAFQNCLALESFDMPDTVTSLGYDILYCTSTSYNPILKEVHLSENITSIPLGTLYNQISLTTVNIPSGVTYLDSNAFYQCKSLSCDIVIPKGVTSIGSSCFYDCESLTSITFEEDSICTTLGNGAFQACSSLTSIVLPSSITDMSGGYVFNGCSSLESITFTNGESKLESIGNYCFYKCQALIEFDIPSSVTSIGTYAFEYCESLEHITIPENITTIETYTFAYMYKLEELIFPDSVTSLGGSAFRNCTSLTYVVIGKGIQSLPNMASYGCSALTSVYFHGSESDFSDFTIVNTNNDSQFNSAAKYYYSDEEVSGYWHYVDGVPTLYS